MVEGQRAAAGSSSCGGGVRIAAIIGKQPVMSLLAGREGSEMLSVMLSGLWHCQCRTLGKEEKGRP